MECRNEVPPFCTPTTINKLTFQLLGFQLPEMACDIEAAVLSSSEGDECYHPPGRGRGRFEGRGQLHP